MRLIAYKRTTDKKDRKRECLRKEGKERSKKRKKEEKKRVRDKASACVYVWVREREGRRESAGE